MIGMRKDVLNKGQYELLKVKMCFANLDAITDEDISNIESAAEHANCNLIYKYDICIVDIKRDEDSTVLLTLSISVPCRYVNAFLTGTGPRLSGIPRYLLKQEPDVYKHKRIGTRLFNYIRVAKAA